MPDETAQLSRQIQVLLRVEMIDPDEEAVEVEYLAHRVPDLTHLRSRTASCQWTAPDLQINFFDGRFT